MSIADSLPSNSERIFTIPRCMRSQWLPADPHRCRRGGEARVSAAPYFGNNCWRRGKAMTRCSIKTSPTPVAQRYCKVKRTRLAAIRSIYWTVATWCGASNALAATANDYVRWLQCLVNYDRALATLERELSFAATHHLRKIERLGYIQTFEFTHDLRWKPMKPVVPATKTVIYWRENKALIIKSSKHWRTQRSYPSGGRSYTKLIPTTRLQSKISINREAWSFCIRKYLLDAKHLYRHVIKQ